MSLPFHQHHVVRALRSLLGDREPFQRESLGVKKLVSNCWFKRMNPHLHQSSNCCASVFAYAADDGTERKKRERVSLYVCERD